MRRLTSKPILAKIPLSSDQRKKLRELASVYDDLERTIRDLSAYCAHKVGWKASAHSIDLEKLLGELTRSKVKVEKSLQEFFPVEKEELRRRLRAFKSSLPLRRRRN